MGKGHKLENVAIRMVKAPPLYSSEPLKTPMDVVRVLGKELEAYDREVLCVVNLRSDLAPINMGYSPYVMVYEKPSAPEETRRLQRWVNNKILFYSVKDFKDYDPGRFRKGR